MMRPERDGREHAPPETPKRSVQARPPTVPEPEIEEEEEGEGGARRDGGEEGGRTGTPPTPSALTHNP